MKNILRRIKWENLYLPIGSAMASLMTIVLIVNGGLLNLLMTIICWILIPFSYEEIKYLRKEQ